ncbi:MAG: phosphotransferase [Anaerolineae bacterium]|nr:phosphotransferase [Anaerolineae bacterium]
MNNQLTAQHILFGSVEAMLAPETLSDILKRRVSQVSYEPFSSSDSFSGSLLYNVTTDGERLVLKRSNPAEDWISIASGDHLCRSVRIWQYGLLDRLQPHIDHVTLAACHDGAGYAILMRDISDGLFYGKAVTLPMMHSLLDALAAMHSQFWGDDSLKDPELGLCTIEQTVKVLWTEHCERYRHDARAVDYVTKGWAALFDLVQPDVRDALQALVANPQPLFQALAQFPATLTHSDYRLGNLALMSATNQVVAFDWQHAGYVPATICLSWFIMESSFFEIREAIAEYYRQQLLARLGQRFDQAIWQSMLALGCLVEVLRKGCWLALFYVMPETEAAEREEIKQVIDSYNDVVRAGLRWL